MMSYTEAKRQFPEVQAVHNELLVLTAVAYYQPIGRDVLLENLGLDRETAERIIASMLECGNITEDGEVYSATRKGFSKVCTIVRRIREQVEADVRKGDRDGD